MKNKLIIILLCFVGVVIIVALAGTVVLQKKNSRVPKFKNITFSVRDNLETLVPASLDNTSRSGISGTLYFTSPVCGGFSSSGETCSKSEVKTPARNEIFAARKSGGKDEAENRTTIRTDNVGNFQVYLTPGEYWLEWSSPKDREKYGINGAYGLVELLQRVLVVDGVITDVDVIATPFES